MDHIELWDKAKRMLQEEVPALSYTTWIDQPLKPVYYEEGKLALEYTNDLYAKTIRSRYLPMIVEAVSRAAGGTASVELMSVQERVAWQQSREQMKRETRTEVNMFNPNSTFDTFVVGSSNQFAHAAALAAASAATTWDSPGEEERASAAAREQVKAAPGPGDAGRC